MCKIIDDVDLAILWHLKPPELRPEILRILRTTLARSDRRWYIHPVCTERCLIIGQSPLEIQRRARALVVFVTFPSALVFAAAAFGLPTSHLAILSITISLVSAWMLARIKARKLSEVKNR